MTDNELMQAWDATRKGDGPYWIDMTTDQRNRISDMIDAATEDEQLREEVHSLEMALEQARGEILELRDKLKEAAAPPVNP